MQRKTNFKSDKLSSNTLSLDSQAHTQQLLLQGI